MSFLTLLFFVPSLYGQTEEDTKDGVKQVLEFTNNEKVDENGIPLDSTINYFPLNLFSDLEEIRNTFKIAGDSLKLGEAMSFMLYKMEEPVLNNHYLNQDVYRITILFPFANPLSICMEKNNDVIKINTKELNTSITNIYAKIKGEVKMTTHYPLLTKEDSIRHKNWLDRSLRNHLHKKKDKDGDYYISNKKQKELTLDKWHTIEAMADSARFWRTKSKPFLEKDYQADGVILILEGHTKQGYQIKCCQVMCIPSPLFEIKKYSFRYDNNNYYDRIFKMMLEYSETDVIDFY